MQCLDEIERLRTLDVLVPEICQLIDGCKQDWQPQGCWSEWDQSVRDRLSAYSIQKMLTPNVEVSGDDRTRAASARPPG